MSTPTCRRKVDTTIYTIVIKNKRKTPPSKGRYAARLSGHLCGFHWFTDIILQGNRIKVMDTYTCDDHVVA